MQGQVGRQVLIKSHVYYVVVLFRPQAVADLRFLAPVRLAKQIDGIQIIPGLKSQGERKVVDAGGCSLLFGIERSVLVTSDDLAVQLENDRALLRPPCCAGVTLIVIEIGVNSDLRTRGRVLLPSGKQGAAIAQNDRIAL